MFINHRQDDWANWLLISKFAYNNHIHASTHHTPFELDTGQHPCMGTKFPRTSTIEAADAFVTCMAQMKEEAKATLSHATDEMARYYDQHCQYAP